VCHRSNRRFPPRRIFFLGLLPALVASPATTPLVAQGDDPSPHSDAWLTPEVTSIQPGSPFTVAVRFTMDPGWHNYWRNAGDSGLPTTVEWDLPEGFTAGELQWPYPERIEVYPLVDYGYSDEVALLVEITPPANLPVETTAALSARVDWLICERICLPAYARLEVEIPVARRAPEVDNAWATLFRETRNRLPKAVPEWDVTAEVTEEGYRLRAEAGSANSSVPETVYFFAAVTSVLAHAQPQGRTRVAGGFTLDLAGSPYALAPTPRLRGVLLAEDGQRWAQDGDVVAMAVDVPVEGVPEPPPDTVTSSGQEPDLGVQGTTARPAQGGFTLFLALGFAFLGGILLNLMPCVFPILSLKVLGAASQGGADRRSIRNQGLFFGLGVVLSFLALAGALIGLRTGGAQLGWGFQLQSPFFVGAMATLFFAIGLNLIGVFEVGVALTRLGSKPGAPKSHGESLASGILATVIATPCTAPFMGAALGFAFTRSVPETLLIFGSLGVGMALPFVVLSLAPGLLERLPRPGPWMETMRQLLAFPMFATVIWLVWVYGQQTGVAGATYLLTALLLIAAAGWMVGRWHRTDVRSGLVARWVSLVALALAAASVTRGSGQAPPLLDIQEGWQPFSSGEVSSALERGQPVFVDFTAAWCLTCQVNERLVLSTETVMEAFRTRRVALLKADWTRQDSTITAALEALGRNGVPVYALYPGHPGADPHILPALLTEEIVLDALTEVISPSRTRGLSSLQNP
jgi:thiol:disulfide interchange protein/DsbC/DsbD-like thiol-disulfide interchange protein